ncbi:hypothetical protein [Pandoravirus japonicus]|uniref:Uncharacterized protein n=1 Tax=Pandoravirus japonicus TaxID=2823154 RepID=A0A811BRK3_9VIRU|nr:hypothetical protein [Pandoravirus japonicus]
MSGLWDRGAAIAQQIASNGGGHGRRRRTWPVVLFSSFLYRASFFFFLLAPKKKGKTQRGRAGHGLLPSTVAQCDPSDSRLPLSVVTIAARLHCGWPRAGLLCAHRDTPLDGPVEQAHFFFLGT